MERTLSGRRIAVLAADGFEKVELTVPVAALRAAGAEVDIVSLRHGRIRGVNMHEPASRVRVTKTVNEAWASNYDALFIPGGLINPDLLRQSAEARRFVRAFDDDQKPIASICHGPWVLASAELLSGRVLTSWPGIRDDLVHAGATWIDQPVARDGNLLTSRGPHDLVPFSKAIVEHFQHRRFVRTSDGQVTMSAPQRDAPPQAMLTAMKWMPRPSLRTAIGLGALAAGVIAMNRRRERGSRMREHRPDDRELTPVYQSGSDMAH